MQLAKRVAKVDKGRCVACGACAKVCPRSAIRIVCGCYAQVAMDLCVGCGKCSAECPADSIGLIERVRES
ncbi:MAG: 4Fe-4S binding protein [Oliverpabstia sp.]